MFSDEPSGKIFVTMFIPGQRRSLDSSLFLRHFDTLSRTHLKLLLQLALRYRFPWDWGGEAVWPFLSFVVVVVVAVCLFLFCKDWLLYLYVRFQSFFISNCGIHSTNRSPDLLCSLLIVPSLTHSYQNWKNCWRFSHVKRAITDYTLLSSHYFLW